MSWCCAKITWLGHSCAKVHTCGFDVERNLTPGEDFYVTTLDTHCGEVKVGAMICYDREFPESARILMLKGAELDLEQLRRYRENEVHGNAFRRPQKYGLLLDAKIEPPFIRNICRQ